MKQIMRRYTSLLWIAILVCSGCGGSGEENDNAGSGGSNNRDNIESEFAFEIMTESEASRLLQQATFGATPRALKTAAGMTPYDWVDEQLYMRSSTPSGSYLSYIDQQIALNERNKFNTRLLYNLWWQHLAKGDDQLRQRMAFALSEIFVVSSNGSSFPVRRLGAYYDILLRNAFGNFRDLLEEVTLSPTMGFYLTYFRNEKENDDGTRLPDENYAREVMQLFTIGLNELNLDGSLRLDGSGNPIPTYSGDDIRGLAKVFTGLSQPPGAPGDSFRRSLDPDALVKPMIFYPKYHSTSEKRFLDVVIPEQATPDPEGDLKIALDALFNHPNVGPFIAKQLIQRFVTSNPSQAYVKRVAMRFNDNGFGVRGDLKAVLQAILLDDEARDLQQINSPSYGKLREPIIRLANWIRAFDAESTTGDWLVGSTSNNKSLGQSVLASPSVFNFFRPGYTPSINTELGARNLTAPEFQIENEVSVAGYLNVMRSAISGGTGYIPGGGRDINSDYDELLALADDPDALVDRVSLLLTANQLRPNVRDLLIAELNDIQTQGEKITTEVREKRLLSRVRTTIFLIMSSSDYIVQR